MINLKQLAIEACVAELRDTYLQTYGEQTPHFNHTLQYCARQSLEQIATTDTLYHNVEHTIMAALAGQAILKGKQLSEGTVSPCDWMHATLALLYHDIGFVRGICHKDQGEEIATGLGNQTIPWPAGKSAAALAPYHVDRSKLFLRECFAQTHFQDVDHNIISDCIERTRFPIPADPIYQETEDLPGLVRAADLIGQLADPDYLRKIPALFYEFEEIGMNKKFGYGNVESMRKGYAKFFNSGVSPYIQAALNYLAVTHIGQQWIANLYVQVMRSEQENACTAIALSQTKVTMA